MPTVPACDEEAHVWFLITLLYGGRRSLALEQKAKAERLDGQTCYGKDFTRQRQMASEGTSNRRS